MVSLGGYLSAAEYGTPYLQKPALHRQCDSGRTISSSVKPAYRRKKKSLHASEQERPRCDREGEKPEQPYIWVQCK